MVEKIIDDFHQAEEKYKNLSQFKNKGDFLERLLEVHGQIERKSHPDSNYNGITEMAQFGELMPEASYLFDWMLDSNPKLVSNFLCNKLSDEENKEFNKLTADWFDWTKEKYKTSVAA
jgi:hypothetical protein